jgi:hypothetical protein
LLDGFADSERSDAYRGRIKKFHVRESRNLSPDRVKPPGRE